MTSTCEITGPLFTDLYELTMMAAYFDAEMNEDATFSLFVRPNPEKRNYFVAAGLEKALDEITNMRFTQSDIDYLESTRLFSGGFLAWLEGFRFSGDIDAMEEGTVFFGNEPVLEVTAPLMEAQLLETFLINTIGFNSLIATKTARCVHAAKGRPVVDFSLRRTQGQDAGMTAARSAWITGAAGTSNVIAGKKYGIPVSGTMAHSFVSAFDSEKDSFDAFSKTFPGNTTLLIDTYDTLKGAEKAVEIGLSMKKEGKRLNGVRLDSGDMVDLSKKVRDILDKAGLTDVNIFASSGFDEYKLSDVLERGAAIDAFGVGTSMGVSADVPYNDTVYKLVRYKGRDVKKFSTGKVTLAGKKQVFRFYDETGICTKDIIGLYGEMPENGEPLLKKVVKKGKITRPHPELDNIRETFAKNFSALGDRYKDISREAAYPVSISRELEKVQAAIKNKLYP